MAGHRRRRNRERRDVVRAANRHRYRAAHMQRLAAARTPSARLAAALDYLRSAIAAALDRAEASRAADEVVADLIARADRLLARTTSRRDKR